MHIANLYCYLRGFGGAGEVTIEAVINNTAGRGVDTDTRYILQASLGK